MFVGHFDCWLTKPPWTALIHIYHCLPTTSVVINQLYLLIISWDHHPKENMKPTSQIFRVSPSFVLAISQCLWVERQCVCLFSLVWYLICLSSGNQTKHGNGKIRMNDVIIEYHWNIHLVRGFSIAMYCHLWSLIFVEGYWRISQGCHASASFQRHTSSLRSSSRSHLVFSEIPGIPGCRWGICSQFW